MNRAEKRRQQKLAKKAAKKGKTVQPASPSAGQQISPIQQSLYLGVQHQQAGDLSKADSLYQQVLSIDPEEPTALHLLGVIAYQAGKIDNAVEFFTKALAVKPDNAETHNNLGAAFQGLGKLEEAEASFCKALAIEPENAEAHNNLGAVLQELGKSEDAVASCHKALAIKPDYAEAHNNLGMALQGLAKLDEAVASYNKALAIKPDYPEAHHNLGLALQEQGLSEDALTCQRRAIALNPENDSFWVSLVESIETLSFTYVDDNLLNDLWNLLERPTVASSRVVRPVINALRHDPDFSKILEQTDSGNPEMEMACGEAVEQLSATPLFLRILALSPINDLEIERALTVLRRAILKEAVAEKMNEKGLPFSSALALQCFTNEYVFPETNEEKTDLESLEKQIAMLVEKKRDVPPLFVAVLGSYRPLYSFSWAQELSERKWAGNIKEVIQRQISEPFVEQSLRPQIPCLTPVQDKVSQSVREQYEENPYPRWVKTGTSYKSRAIGTVLQGAPLYLNIQEYASPEEPEILVAGCGTGQHALVTASRFLNAHVFAVDLSLSSLTYALRKTNELGFSNIEYAQADIMELENLGRQFDLIECSGVLHHLGDPLAGWRILVELLRPGGLMNIGLYSETARQDIISGCSLVAEKGYTMSPEDIRRCRQDIITKAEDGNPMMARICNRGDFFSLSECCDLLFHVQEHRFVLPQIEEALKALNLKFLGFEMRDQSTQKKFRASYPEERALTSLPHWHKFELKNPDTFRGMYQFWCRKI